MLRVKAKSKLMSYITREHCVIVLRLEPQRKVIATSDQEATLQEQWDWIEQNILSTLSNDENLRSEMLAFLESKFEIFADTEAQQKAKAEADALFVNTFNLEDESMICCTFQFPRSILAYCMLLNGNIGSLKKAACLTSRIFSINIKNGRTERQNRTK